MQTRLLTALVFGLLLGLTPSYAATLALDCSTVKTDALRLRCWDDSARIENSKAGAILISPPAKPYFIGHPATPYTGPVHEPDFSGPNPGTASYRAALIEGAKHGPNFAGYLSLVTIDDGPAYSSVHAVDVRSGAVPRLPLGGPDAQSLRLEYRVDSDLIAARYEDADVDRCIAVQFVWTGRELMRTSRTSLGPQSACRMPSAR